MTLVDSQGGSSTPHVGELKLRRFRAGEFSGEAHAEIVRHTSDCGSCRAKLRTLQEEQREFEREIPFERFAGGVERAFRVPRPRPRRLWALGSTFGFAAAAAVVLLIWPGARVHDAGREGGRMRGHNQVKGGTSALVRIASAAGGAQRSLLPAEKTTLRPGERIRVGYTTETPRYLSAVSLDDQGEVSALYPEAGGSLAVAATARATYLPDSLQFTGSGQERVFLFLADRPLDAEVVKQSVRNAQAQAHGDLATLPPPTFEGRTDVRQFTWLFQKP
jgi:hypothetical protein